MKNEHFEGRCLDAAIAHAADVYLLNFAFVQGIVYPPTIFAGRWAIESEAIVR